MISETQKEKGTDIKLRGNSYSCREEQKFETQSCVLHEGKQDKAVRCAGSGAWPPGFISNIHHTGSLLA